MCPYVMHTNLPGSLAVAVSNLTSDREQLNSMSLKIYMKDNQAYGQFSSLKMEDNPAYEQFSHNLPETSSGAEFFS